MLNRIGVRREGLIVLLMMTLLLILLTARLAKAETTRHTRTSTTTTTTTDSDDDGEGYAPPPGAAIPPPNFPPPGVANPNPPAKPGFVESQMTQTFGSKATSGMAGCKTEALSKGVIKDLKAECAAWVKEQKTDLGKNYLGNTCEDSCDDCDMSLVRCHVTGTVRYRKPTDATVD